METARQEQNAMSCLREGRAPGREAGWGEAALWERPWGAGRGQGPGDRGGKTAAPRAVSPGA